MNLALSTILLFIIIAPGIIARRSYFTHPFSNNAREIELTKEAFWSLIPGFTIHFLYVVTVEKLTKWSISFNDISFLINGKDDNKRLDSIANNIHSHIIGIILYFTMLAAVSFIIGWAAKTMVLKLALDRYSMFRFSNKWYYILSGRIIDVETLEGEAKDIDAVGIDVLCNISGKSYIYAGFLQSYYLSRNGDLDSILLRYPARRKIEDDHDNSKYYEIPSDILLIPNKDIININVRYFNLRTTNNKPQEQKGGDLHIA